MSKVKFKEIIMKPTKFRLHVWVSKKRAPLAKLMSKYYGDSQEYYERELVSDMCALIESSKGSQMKGETVIVICLQKLDLVALVHELQHAFDALADIVGFSLDASATEWKAYFLEMLFEETSKKKEYSIAKKSVFGRVEFYRNIKSFENETIRIKESQKKDLDKMFEVSHDFTDTFQDNHFQDALRYGLFAELGARKISEKYIIDKGIYEEKISNTGSGKSVKFDDELLCDKFKRMREKGAEIKPALSEHEIKLELSLTAFG